MKKNLLKAWIDNSDIIGEISVDSRNTLNDLDGREWIISTKSVWNQTGLGANHPHAQIEKLHPAPFGFKDIAKLICFFTKKGQIVLDPFNGVGSTSKACATTGRLGVGIELSKKWADLSVKRLNEEVGSIKGQKIIQGDANEELKDFPDSYFDFIVTSPPYWSILNKKLDQKTKQRAEKGYDKNYSNDARDLGNIEEYSSFLSELQTIFKKCYRVLRDGKYAVVIVSDFRHGSKFIPYHSDVIKIMEEVGFNLKGITILVQNHKSLHPYGYPFAFVSNIHHQYILIFQKAK